MKILDMKLDGVRSPMGYAMNAQKLTFRVTETESRFPQRIDVRVTCGDDVVFETSVDQLPAGGIALAFAPKPRTEYVVRARVLGDAGDSAEARMTVETGKRDEPWTAKWIGPRREDTFHPVVFADVALQGEVKRARMYVSGVGLYEAQINGRKVGEDLLAPFFNDYAERLQASTYDVTALLQAENRVEILLGNGWYKGRFGLGLVENNYGDRFGCVMELHVEYADGTKQVFVTDETWQYRESFVTQSGIYDGETQDYAQIPGVPRPVALLEMNAPLTDCISLPIRHKVTVPVSQVIHTPAGETVLDMGQNFAGFVVFRCAQPKGTEIRLDFGEVLQQGNFYNANYRTAAPHFIYVSDGEARVVRPRFTYYGFRYVRVTGWTGELNPADFEGWSIYSDLDRTGTFECSDDRINRLFLNALWSQRSNFIDMPTDCPQRDERLGWTGDAQVFAPTACLNMDARAFYEKYLHDMRGEQLRMDGAVPNFLPSIGRMVGSCSVWGDVATFIPKTLYETYGDPDALRRYFPLMRDWVDSITRRDEARTPAHRLYDFDFHFGDWLAQDGVTPRSVKGGTDDSFIASIYYCQSTRIVAWAAGILGMPDVQQKYEQLASEIREAILAEFFTPAGRLAVDTQAAYIISLHFGIYRSREKVLEGFRARLKKDSYAIKCGFVGAPLLPLTLCENGMADLAYHFLLREEFPGWLYCVNLGATTIWERWNSMLPDGTCNGTDMNSFNHYAYGSVVEFLYKYVAGIQSVAPGYRRVRFAPEIDMRFTRAAASYNSVAGEWKLSWEIAPDGMVTVKMTVPFGCTAVAELPRYAGGALELQPGEHVIRYTPTSDFRCRYSLDTRLGEMKRSPAALEILKADAPVCYDMALSDNPEDNCTSLRDLFDMGHLDLTAEQIEGMAAKLEKLVEYEL